MRMGLLTNAGLPPRAHGKATAPFQNQQWSGPIPSREQRAVNTLQILLSAFVLPVAALLLFIWTQRRGLFANPDGANVIFAATAAPPRSWLAPSPRRAG